MNTTEGRARPGAAPAAHAIEHALHTALASSARLAAVLALGLLAARLVRRREVHWGWPAAAAAALAAPAGSGALPLALPAALALAAARARRWQRSDLRAGGDLARAALARRTPLAGLRAAAGPLCAAVGRRRTATGRAGSLALGRARDGRVVRVPFAAPAPRHTLVVGATGSGKTVTQTLIATHAIANGCACIAVDPKGDGAMRRALLRAAWAAGRRAVEWTPDGPAAYNPYRRGSEGEISDRLLAGERFTEPHYLRQAQRYLGHALRALRAGGREVSLRSVVEVLDPAALEMLLREQREPAAAAVAYLDGMTPRQLRDLAGVRDRLAILAESDVGRWLHPEGGRAFDLLEAIRAGHVVYFDLQADRRPLLARMLGAAIVQDLQSAVAELQRSPVPAIAVLDEFSALASEQVVALFGRARSAGLSLLLGTQELTDLRLPGRERLLEQVMGNLSLLLAHRQVVPASAELVARLGGERGAWRRSWTSDGRSTRSRISVPVLEAQEAMALPTGTAAVLEFGRPARVVRIDAQGVTR